MKHKFPYKWYLKDGYPAKGIEPHGCKVFGTFVCGGGSSMGYKLAGFEHLGGVEIDPRMAEVYKLNHKPKHLYLEDIREFNKRDDLPAELYDLDLLDGSPPCSSFSMAGSREKAWGKKKKFREGQAEQVLDDLVFEYVKTIEKLQPKVALLENVKGLITGNAKVYAKRIKQEFTAAGYRVQVFLLNAASMGVPQKRERVFFIGIRNDLPGGRLVLKFEEKGILFGEVEQCRKRQNIKEGAVKELWKKAKEGEELKSAAMRLKGKSQHFTTYVLWNSKLSPTITAGSPFYRGEDCTHITGKEFCQIGTYPLDYNFLETKPKYLIGMSVPPVMTAQIAHQIYLQWLKNSPPKTP